MSRTDGPGVARGSLADERRRVIEALDSGVLTGPAIARWIRERSAAADGGAGQSTTPDDQSLLYPALYRLAADWRVAATWLPDAHGVRHRTYRKRRLLPRRPVET